MKNNIIRTVKYRRVSHAEQKIHGFSLQAQNEELDKFLAEHPDHKLVADVADEGISAVKLKERDALQEILELAKAKKIDLIIFTKLDRWFRSLDQYYVVQRVLEENNVAWMATSEDYETLTAAGRFKVNIMLSVAQQERERTSERIISVFNSKIANGQALMGASNQGYAFTVKPDEQGIKRVVKDDETKDVVEDFINHFLKYQNVKEAHRYVRNKYNVNVSYSSLRKVLLDTKLYGFYKGNPNYCEAYVDKETYDKIQYTLSKNIKNAPSKRIYLFNGLIQCPCCGRTMTGKTNSNPSPTLSYRCNGKVFYEDCDYSHQPNENKIEKALLSNFDNYVTDHINKIKAQDKRARDLKAEDKIADIKSEMTRLNNMYRKGRIKEAEYDNEYEELETRLIEAEKHLAPLSKRDLTIYEELMSLDWKHIYDALSKENKRAFWRKYLKAIEVDDKGVFKRPIFF